MLLWRTQRHECWIVFIFKFQVTARLNGSMLLMWTTFSIALAHADLCSEQRPALYLINRTSHWWERISFGAESSAPFNRIMGWFLQRLPKSWPCQRLWRPAFSLYWMEVLMMEAEMSSGAYLLSMRLKANSLWKLSDWYRFAFAFGLCKCMPCFSIFCRGLDEWSWVWERYRGRGWEK